MKIKAPRNLSDFTSAELAAQGLEAMAKRLREGADIRPRVKWSITLSFWNDEWANPNHTNTMLTRGVSYSNVPDEFNGSPTPVAASIESR